MTAQQECSRFHLMDAGVYYFSVFLLVPYGEYVNIDMTLNDDVICSIQADQNDSGSGDSQAASCSVVLDVVSGKWYFFIWVFS